MELQNNIQRLRALSIEAAKKTESIQASAKCIDEVVPGNVYMFPACDVICEGEYYPDGKVFAALLWVVVQPNRDDSELFYVVPADVNPFVGSMDIEISASVSCGFLAVRCSQGIWIHHDDFACGRCVRVVPDNYIEFIRDKIALLIRGDNYPSGYSEDIDVDPLYEDWVMRVARAVESLEDLLRADPVVVSLSNDFELPVSESPLALAALSGSPHPDFQEKGDPPRIWTTDFSSPKLQGTLFVYFYESKQKFVIAFEGSEEPPGLFVPTQSAAGGRWDRDEGDRYMWSEQPAIGKGVLELYFGGTLFSFN